MERYIVVDNACGWPKLTLMADGSINLDIHDRPVHGSDDGNAACYKSTDGGRTFQEYGISGKGTMEEGAFIDKATGRAHNGDYLVITEKRRFRTTYIFRSSDGGKTFTETGILNKSNALANAYPIPYGSIQRLPGNKLALHYWINSPAGEDSGGINTHNEAHVCFSNDDGYTWEEDYLIDTDINETAILFFDDQHGIAVGRMDAAVTNGETARKDAGGGCRLYRTTDGGVTWECEGTVLCQEMIPAHLLQLSSGETLMTYGVRFSNLRGVMACISSDQGRSWKLHSFLVKYPHGDSGYPSSVELPDGTIVTAYYCQGNEYHTRYHVGVIRWKLSDLCYDIWMDGPRAFWYGTDEEQINDWRING